MFTQEEIENIIFLIQSPVADNVKLAFSMLEGKRKHNTLNNFIETYVELYKWCYGKPLNSTLEMIIHINQCKILDTTDRDSIPTSIKLFRNIETFSTTGSWFITSLSELPNEFADLEHLKTLDLEINNFKEIPTIIRKLKNLTTINFYFNNIQEVPEWIGELTKLEELYLTHNQLEQIPDALTNCKKLKKLYLKENKFSEEEKSYIKERFSYVEYLEI